jgi:hypothetical protein
VTFSLPRNSNTPLVCVVPATGAESASSVNILTVAGDTIASRDVIDATGQSVARSKDGCTGVENAAWSTDGRRLYVTSDFTCPGGLKRTTSGLFAMSARGEWVNVQGVDAGGNKGVQTVRYADVTSSATLPAEITSALHARGGIAVSTARAAAGAPLTSANVIEASHKLDPVVVEAWIVDRGQSFGVDSKQLVALADAGVPGNVTDAMVAVTYPKAFAVNPTDESGLPSIDEAQAVGGSNIERVDRNDARLMVAPGYARYNYSPFGYSPYDYYGYGYSPYGYSPYGAPYGYAPYGGYYSPYSAYTGVYGGGWYTRPIIVLKGNEPATPRGTAVKGRGYTRSAPRNGGSSGSNGSTASPRPAVAPPSPPPPPPSQPASTGRTAHERP